MKKTWRDIALAILNTLFPSERPTQSELDIYYEEQRRQHPDCLRCPLRTQERIWNTMTAEELASYEPPSPTTEGKMTVYGARQRHITRELQRKPGLLMKHNRTMQEQRQRAQHEPDTKILPSVHVTRDLRGLLNNDDEREKKIS